MLTRPIRIRKLAALLALAALIATRGVAAEETITSPRSEFGHEIGDDYLLVNYSQLTAYWNKLARESDRMTVEEIGRTEEGRPMIMAIITSPENHRRLERYRNIAAGLARAKGLTDEMAQAMAREGKAVVWIDGGLHANEVLGAQQLIATVYNLVSSRDAETLRILDDTITLICPVNPDGMEMVSNWYMRESKPERRSLAGLPQLYQKYAGHDNNRDFYMSALAETRAINSVLYRKWFPEIVYDHHQSAPAGTVMFSPPFRDPFNYTLDPMVITTLDEIGAAMHTRFAEEGKGGVTSRSGGMYSTWWNGGLRTTPYFHNMIGLLTETIGNPTPMELPFVASTQLPRSDLPLPAPPQTWRFRQSIEYSVTANRAVLDYASRNRDRLLYGIYRMGRNAIERGSRDNWTATPAAITSGGAARKIGSGLAAADTSWKTPERRDARGYIVTRNQPDFLTAVKFVNALINCGIDVDQATEDFSVADRRYPRGSYVIRTAQAFRPHILDMFEPQDHPNDFAFAGAPPTPPYDGAGWTLAFQMGVRFDRILDAFDGPFVRVDGAARPPAGSVSTAAPTAGYLFSHETNDSFIAVNRLVGSGETVFWINPDGTHFIAEQKGTAAKLKKLAAETGLQFDAVSSVPDRSGFRLRPVRVGVWERPGGSVAAGWTRLILENFEFPYRAVDTAILRAGNLNAQFDVIIIAGDDAPSDNPGALSLFMEQGGTILAIGKSTAVAARPELPLKAPIENALA
ncbi:MAG TPA: M14 metallopeptidase family protein, partial [Terriglobia bacterium]|nr:M14 metallopeptidase family protein [Terriglobia bacterium]